MCTIAGFPCQLGVSVLCDLPNRFSKPVYVAETSIGWLPFFNFFVSSVWDDISSAQGVLCCLLHPSCSLWNLAVPGLEPRSTAFKAGVLMFGAISLDKFIFFFDNT